MELKTAKKIIVGVAIFAVGFIIVASAVVPDDDLPAEIAFSNFIPQSPIPLPELVIPESEVVAESVTDEFEIPLINLSLDEIMLKTESEIEQYVFQYTNEEREKAGLPPFVYDEKLSAIAKAHAEDMAARNYYEHDNPEGQYPTDRAIAAGYRVHKDLAGGYTLDGISENIHKLSYGLSGGVYLPKYDSQKIARKLVDDWMGSEGHRYNILRDISTNIGIGVKFDGDRWFYAVQDFW